MAIVNVLRNIPEDKRKSIVLATIKIDELKHKMQPNIQAEFELLFDMWNTYVQPHNKQKITCKGCRTNIFSQFKYHVQGWKEYEENS